MAEIPGKYLYCPDRSPHPHSAAALAGADARWRAANFRSVGQLYLLDNPLLRLPLTRDHLKPRLPGRWGTTPGLMYPSVPLNRVALLRQGVQDARLRARNYTRDHGDDIPAVIDWVRDAVGVGVTPDNAGVSTGGDNV